MRVSSLNKNYAIVTAVMIAVIVYGSLYPFAFRMPPHGIGPLQTLLRSWADRPGRGDFLSNILLYTPLGFFGVLALRNEVGPAKRAGATLLLGTVLCVAMELTQYYDEGRVTSFDDVYANVIGTAIGAVAGITIGDGVRWPLLREIALNRIPALLLFAWVGYRLYPFVPTIDLHKYWNALKPVILYPSLTSYDLLRHTAAWMTIYMLIETIGRRQRPWLLLPLFTGAVLFAKVLVITTVLSVAEIAGAGVAYALWLLLYGSARSRILVATLLLGLAITAQRLEPFQFHAAASPFGWIPFLSFMRGSTEIDVMSFLEKFFLYGSLIWLLGEAGLPRRSSAIAAAALLFVTSLAETHVAHRSAEITDTVMALMIAGIFALVDSVRSADTLPSPASPPSSENATP